MVFKLYLFLVTFFLISLTFKFYNKFNIIYLCKCINALYFEKLFFLNIDLEDCYSSLHA